MLCVKNHPDDNSAGFHSFPPLVTGQPPLGPAILQLVLTGNIAKVARTQATQVQTEPGSFPLPGLLLNNLHDASGTDWELESGACFPFSSYPIRCGLCSCTARGSPGRAW